MASLLAFPLLGILLIIQSAVVSRIPLLQGTADLVLLALIGWGLQKQVRSAVQWALIGGLLVGYVSAVPYYSHLIGYLIVVVMALILRQRVWQVPLLAMLVTTFFGTFIVHLVSLVALRVAGAPMPFWDSINLITLPSVLLNLLLAVPFYVSMGDLANWLYLEELEM